MSATTVLRSRPGRAALVTALALAAGGLTLLPGGAPSASAAGLVAWSDCDALTAHYRSELVRTATAWGIGGSPGGVGLAADTSAGGAMRAEAAAPAAAPAPGMASEQMASTDEAVGSGPTGTNVQERGVDEPDVAKTSGDLLLVVAQGRLQVLRAGRQPVLLGSVALGPDAHAGELLVDGDRALVLVSRWRPAPGGPEPLPMPEPVPVEPAPMPEPMPVDPGIGGEVPPAGPAVEPLVEPDAATSTDVQPMVLRSSMVAMGEQLVEAVLVDLSDPADPSVLERLELDGRYLSARLVDGTVRLVTSSSPQVAAASPVEPFGPEQEQAALAENRRRAEQVGPEQVLPGAVRRGPGGEELSSGPAVDCADVRHAADRPTGTSTLVVTTLRPADGLAPVDSTAVTTDGDLVYASAERLYVATSRWGTVAPAGDAAPSEDVTTELHAFDTSAPGASRYVGSGSVPGYVYGRWALSSHEGHLRVATTLQPPWGAEPTSSSLFVLAEREDGLAQVGRLDGLGPDERIYAVRYLGDLATVVTFRQTDPLYVVDLADPTAPRLLGELKVPGFSTYLHPIGDDRLLGLGQDADEQGRVTGMQASVFDLSDLSAPTQVDRLPLGEGWSPALDDSRAFSYDPERRLAVLPLQVFDPAGGPGSQAVGIRVTEDFRLVEAGRLTTGSQVGVDRVLLGPDAAYAVSQEGVVAAAPGDLARTGEVRFG